jgi:hypothetical protein
MFGVPAENLTTQGYAEQYLKINTQEPERANRRVTSGGSHPSCGMGQPADQSVDLA